MFDKFNIEVNKIFKWAEREMFELNHPYVGTEHLLLSLLKNSKDIKKISSNYNLSYESFKKELVYIVGNASKKSTFVLYTPLLKRVINCALEDARKDGKELSDIYLFRSIFDEGEGIAIRVLLGMGIDIDSLYDDIKINNKKSKKKNLEILNIGRDLTEEVSFDEKVVGREKEIELIIETLVRKNKNNPLLIGDAGVGKTAIVEELARMIKNGDVPSGLLNKKIVTLELGSLVAGTKYRGEFEEKLTKIVNELIENQDIIVFIDEIHTIVNAGGAEGAINASDILKPYLARGKIKIIGATTTGEYNKYIIKDKALQRRFETIKVLEPSVYETIDILNKVKNNYEVHYGIKISPGNIEDIVMLGNKYVTDKRNPDKSLDILDSVCAMISVKKDYSINIRKIEKEIKMVEKDKEVWVKNNDYEKAMECLERIDELKKKENRLKKDNKRIGRNDILNYLSQKCNIPLLENNRKLIRKLEKDLKKNILGQDEAIDKIIEALNIHLENVDKPMSLLLTGSTGVGKTETVKQVAKSLKMNMIRLDMSEYNLDISVNRLLGASAGYVGYNDEVIFNKIKMYPYSIILVDELEKASNAVINLFLQIMDEGFVTNAQGERLDFKNTFIFMTSNVEGSRKIGFNESNVEYSNNFTKEFLARFDDIINYKKIDKDTVMKYLKKIGVNDISIINEFDYEKEGLRNIKKKIKRKLININN